MLLPGGLADDECVAAPGRETAGYSAAQVREAERPFLEAGVALMARAVAGLTIEVQRVLAAHGRRTGHLLVLVGSGSNGGDALFAAAELVRAGSSAVVVLLGRRAHAAGLAAAIRAGARVLPPDTTAGRIAAEAARADVVLDGVLGTGSSGGLRPPARQVVARILESAGRRAAVIAVDLPSGVGPDDGAVHRPVLRADVTVTFGAVKAGLLLAPGRQEAGAVRLIDIGLGPALDGVRPLLPAGILVRGGRADRQEPHRRR